MTTPKTKESATPELKIDPFLLAHKVGHSTFDISGSIAPVSIRDQMTRAMFIVQRASKAKLIAPPDNEESPYNDLLVLGAGAAGMTAALYAVHELGIRTWLVEKEDVPFTRQLESERFIDPTLYDWPASHWNNRVWRHGPLEWGGGAANVVLSTWLEQYRNIARYHEEQRDYLLECRWNSTLQRLPTNVLEDRLPVGLSVIVKNRESKRTEEHSFGAFLICTGFGKEDVECNKFKCHSFWKPDDFEETFLGCDNSPRVLISGGGDGALQDFMRALLDPQYWDPRHFYGSIETTVQSTGDIGHEAWEKMLTSIQEAEDTGQRYLLWGMPHKLDHPMLEWLHKEFKKAIAELISQPPVRDAVFSFLQGALRGDLQKLTHVYSCTHFSRSYALNRFLVLLLQAYFDNVQGDGSGKPGIEVKYRQGLTVNKVMPANDKELKLYGSAVPAKKHVCRKYAKTCHGKIHMATLGPRDCEVEGLEPASGDILPADIIVLRHGTRKFGRVWRRKGARIAFTRQMLPYWPFPIRDRK